MPEHKVRQAEAQMLDRDQSKRQGVSPTNLRMRLSVRHRTEHWTHHQLTIARKHISFLLVGNAFWRWLSPAAHGLLHVRRPFRPLCTCGYRASREHLCRSSAFSQYRMSDQLRINATAHPQNGVVTRFWTLSAKSSRAEKRPCIVSLGPMPPAGCGHAYGDVS
jgi:hypothetical protein